MNIRERALRIAQTQVGVKEDPPGSNWGPKVRRYLAAAGIKVPAPWCAAFVTWCYAQAGKKLTFPNRASVGFFEDWAKKEGFLVTKPQRGDLVVYRWDDDDWPDHIGFIEKVTAIKWNSKEFAGRATTIEGNWDNQVKRGTRWFKRARFIRIR